MQIQIPQNADFMVNRFKNIPLCFSNAWILAAFKEGTKANM